MSARPVLAADCAQPPVARAPLAQETGVYRAGPLLLVTGEDLAQLPAGQLARGSGSDSIAVLSGDRPVVLSVDPGSTGRLSLWFAGNPTATQASRGEPAARFPACGPRVKRFAGGVSFRGRGCAQLHVFEAGRPPIPMLIPIGNSLRGCPGAANPRPQPRLLADTFLGVSCPIPNSILCERLGVSVGLARPAALIAVQIAGRLVVLDPPPAPPETLWTGYLSSAGLAHGPLDVHARGGLWDGELQPNPPVTVTVFYADGTAATASGTGFVHPGFG